MSNIEKHRAFLDSLEGAKGLPEKIAEQANEIERLKAANDMAEKARINSSLNEYYRKSL